MMGKLEPSQIQYLQEAELRKARNEIVRLTKLCERLAVRLDKAYRAVAEEDGLDLGEEPGNAMDQREGKIARE